MVEGFLEYKHCDIITINLVVEQATKWLMGSQWLQAGCAGLRDLLHLWWGSVRFHDATHKNAQFKTCELFLEFSTSYFRAQLTAGNWDEGEPNLV
jgi:hypothetical protein